MIEHPVTSYAWKMPQTLELLKSPLVESSYADLCMFTDVDNPNKKPLRFAHFAPWFPRGLKRCDGRHSHAPDLAGKLALKSGQYPAKFCSSVAKAYGSWAAQAAPPSA